MADAATAIPARGESKKGSTLKRFLTYSPGKIKPQEIILFCRQLASFVRVGIPVTSAITTFAEQATSQRMRETFQAVVRDIESGVRLSDALAQHPRVFPVLLSDMIRSAEVTGNLEAVLRQAARHIERDAAARQKIKAAMMYPAIIASFAIVVAIGIVLFVLPKFQDLYSSLGARVPGLLAGLLSLSHFVRSHVLTILAVLVLLVVLFWLWIRTENGRYAFDAFLLKIPVVRMMMQTSMTERFCRTLGDMMAAGVPISQTYSVVISNIRNRVYRKALIGATPAIAAGQGLYRPISQIKIFSPSVLQMFRVGEETGHLDSNLIETADMHEEELDYRIKRLTAFLEPAMIIFVGLMVGFIAVTLISSIYSLAGNYQ